MFAPERGVEVVPDELDGTVEAFVGRDAGRRSFEGLRMAGRVRAGRSFVKLRRGLRMLGRT